VTEGASDERAPAAEAEQADIEEGDAGEEEIDYNTIMSSKPSHLDFGKSTVSKADMPMMIKLGYFGEAKKKLIRFGGKCWGEGEDATLRSRPSPPSLHQRRQDNGQTYPSSHTPSDEDL
jgi:hypothetical protein